MNLVEVKNKKQQREFINFRKRIYKKHSKFVDNNLMMINELFAGKTPFCNNKKIYIVYVEDKGKTVCQGVIIYAKELSEYIQLAFFEAEENQENAVNLLVNKTIEIGKKHKCKKLVVGLNGHVNYGLGFLASHYDEKNSFSSSGNPEYYNKYFKDLGCEEIKLNTYKMDRIDNQIGRYQTWLEKLNQKYTFRYFDKKRFDEDSKIYTDLNNATFNKHRYYYQRMYEEDKEMLKELFLFMHEDSLIFAFDGEKPIGFIMWYPDYNELAKAGEIFGAKHFIKNKIMGNKIQTVKVMEYGVLEEYRKKGVPLGLLKQVFLSVAKDSLIKAETSWILEENLDSNRVCQAVCHEKYKRYVAYEKEIK